MSLITPYEVLQYSPAKGSTYPTVQFCELIPQIEQELARDCLGLEFYDYLVENLAEVPAGVLEYDPGQTYAIDDKVIRNGCLFVSLVNSNNSDPLKETGDWEAFPRFTVEAVNDFWRAYLRRLLALKVYMSSLIYSAWQPGAGGITVAAGDRDGFRAVNKGELGDVKRGVISEIERVTTNMLAWLRENGEDAGFPTAFVCKNLCQTQGKVSRRWAWKY